MDQAGKIRVLIVDDHPITRLGISSIVKSQPDMDLAGEAGTAQEAIEAFDRCRPDITLMDIGLPDRSGIQAIQTIRQWYPEALFVVLTNFEGDEDIHLALEAGARAYVLKGMSHDVLVNAVRRVHSGHRFLPHAVLKTLDSRSPDATLSPRERQVLALVVDGLSNKEIGSRLGISEVTVKRHMGSILVRLEVSDRTQAVVAALRRGLAHL